MRSSDSSPILMSCNPISKAHFTLIIKGINFRIRSGELLSDSDVWDASTSLFTVWVGINDVDLSYTFTNVTNTTYVTLFEQYRALVDTLYEEGARNFMLINVPPIDRAPVTTGFSTAATRVPECHAAIANWNERLQDLQTDLEAAYSDATVFYIDANTLFNDVIDDPTEFAATSTYQDTADYCAEYTKYDASNYTSADCEYPIDGYLWLNSLHPTTAMHDLLAERISYLLS